MSSLAPDAPVERMVRTYRASRGTTAYGVVFCLVWFGGFVYVIIDFMGDLRHDPHWAIVVVVLGMLLLGLLPAFIGASYPYRITLIDDEECEFYSLLRQRLVRVQRVRKIDWNEDEIDIVHDGGKVRIGADPEFIDFVVRLLELNPAIKMDAGTRRALASTD